MSKWGDWQRSGGVGNLGLPGRASFLSSMGGGVDAAMACCDDVKDVEHAMCMMRKKSHRCSRYVQYYEVLDLFYRVNFGVPAIADRLRLGDKTVKLLREAGEGYVSGWLDVLESVDRSTRYDVKIA